MKTERRHELQNNALAAVLTEFLEKYRSQAGLVGGLLALAIVVWLAMSYMSQAAQQANAGSWSAYFQATEVRGSSEQQFNVVAENFGDTMAGKWASFSAASNVLAQASQSTFTNREDAKAKLQIAKEQFETLKDVQDPLLRPRVMLGLAQTMETLGALGGTESLNEATSLFESIIADYPDTEIARSAEDQLRRLKQNQTNGWYAWFATQEPVADPLSNQPGLFNNINTTPADPNVPIPGAGNLIRPDGENVSDPVTIADETSDGSTGIDITAPDTSDLIEGEAPIDGDGTLDLGGNVEPEVDDALQDLESSDAIDISGNPPEAVDAPAVDDLDPATGADLPGDQP